MTRVVPELTIAFRQLIELESGLRQLDAIRESEDALVPLMFETKVSYKLMRTAEVVAKERSRFDKLDRQAAKDAGYFDGMTANEANAAKADSYQRKRAEILDTEIKVELATLKIEELLNRPEEFKKSKRNPVPQSVLARLAPIIEREDA